MPARVKSPIPLNNHITEWRLHRQMTQQQLGDAIGATKSTISRIERGKIALMPAAAQAIATSLRTDPDSLVRRPPNAGTSEEEALLSTFRGSDKAQRLAIAKAARTVMRSRFTQKASQHQV